jgi:hypothetical protein
MKISLWLKYPKLKWIYPKFVYNNHTLEEVPSYKYLKIDIHHKLNSNIVWEKLLVEVGNLFIVLKIIVEKWRSDFGEKKKLVFNMFIIQVIINGCKVQGCSVFKETWRKIEQIWKHFIIHNLKIKSNMPCPILILKVGLPPMQSKAMISYLLYKYKLVNIRKRGFRETQRKVGWGLWVRFLF